MHDAGVTYDPSRAVSRHTRLAVYILLALVVGVGGLGSLLTVSGAVVAPGELVVISNVKKIQHPTGGVVASIAVQDGARVHAGQVLLSLDPTVASVDATVVSDAVDKLTARQERLESERDGRARVSFPASLSSRETVPGVKLAMDEETRLFHLRTAARADEKAQLKERKVQLSKQIEGYRAQIAAKQDQLKLLEQELVGVRKLFDRNLVPLSRLNALERDGAQLRGDMGQLESSIAEANGKISELDIQILQVDENARTEAGGQLADAESKLSDLQQRNASVQQDLRRIELRAPQDGVVDKLAVHTVGGVVTPGEVIMEIVPDKDRLYVQAKVRPTDIDQVHFDQKASLRFGAFNQRTTPQLNGSVQRISADLETNEKTNASYYVVDLNIPDQELKRLDGRKLKAGMPVESFIQTEKRSMISYLIRPLAEQLGRAFREP